MQHEDHGHHVAPCFSVPLIQSQALLPLYYLQNFAWSMRLAGRDEYRGQPTTDYNFQTSHLLLSSLLLFIFSLRVCFEHLVHQFNVLLIVKLTFLSNFIPELLIGHFTMTTHA